VLWQITEALVRLVAPILTFTADEIWEYLPAVEGRPISVDLALFPKPEEIFSENPLPLIDKWSPLLKIREKVLQKIEDLRKEKVIGKSLECEAREVTYRRPDHTSPAYGADFHFLTELFQDNRPLLEEIFITSPSKAGLKFKAEYVPQEEMVARNPHLKNDPWLDSSDPIPPRLDFEEIEITVVEASGTKCNRCLRYTDDTSSYGIWENVCTRCQSALREMGIEPPQSGAAQAEVRQ
jgi:isoleucyl-tRNA synthetase